MKAEAKREAWTQDSWAAIVSLGQEVKDMTAEADTREIGLQRTKSTNPGSSLSE